METAVNGVRLHYEVHGEGSPIVLVHGAWSDGNTWRFVAPVLTGAHTVVQYDRRGHSRSGHVAGQTARRVHEQDLVALIEQLDLGPVHLVGNSYGASIVLAAAARRPDLVLGVAAHEPPLVGAADPGSDLGRDLAAVTSIMEQSAAGVERGEAERAAALFAEEAVLGPGAWQMLPAATKAVMVANAWTFVDMLGDPSWADVPDAAPVPTLLTAGAVTPAWLPAIVTRLAETTHRAATRLTFPGAGHAPHLTHPVEYATAIAAFVAETATARAA